MRCLKAFCRHSSLSVVLCSGLILSVVGCSAGSGPGSTTQSAQTSGGTNTGGTSNPGSSSGGTTSLGTGGSLSLGQLPPEPGGSGGMSPADDVIRTLPAGFTATEIGGFKLGERLTEPSGGAGAGGSAGSGGGGGAGNEEGDCGNILLAVVRDFKGAKEGGHPDFEADIYGGNVTPGLVQDHLGPDQKPVYASQCELGHPGGMALCPYGAQNTSEANFDQWYNDAPGVNDPYLVKLWFAPRPNGVFTFQSLSYFPIDGAGFMGSAQADDGMQHNFHFTTELHTRFRYNGGETFNFEGDDDVWVFLNGKLAVDIGGLHPMEAGVVDLDGAAADLGITKGNIYTLDLFHAERHTTASTFRIDTNLTFVDCGLVVPSVIK